ncbi:exonuclease V [Aspergillus foveolatus]|uniref:exonuclease V n=1 Tax=Aspergillus foveolatus TaxID=210207 RepID=UPI003CCE3C87
MESQPEKEDNGGVAEKGGYDPWRTMRHLTVGIGSSIPSYTWFMFLHNSFNFASKPLSILTKVVVQQAVFTPVFNTYFFSVHSLLSGASLEETWERLKVALPRSIVNSAKFWPMVTAFSFMYVPPQFRNVFSGMSYSPQPPFVPPPDDDDALSSSSDYGSDFSADETDLLNQLLAQVDATGSVATAATTLRLRHNPTRQGLFSPSKPVPAAVPDIEDLGDDVSGERVSRILGREKRHPLWQVQTAGGALSDAFTLEAGWVPFSRGATFVEHPDSTEGRERQRERDVAREQASIKGNEDSKVRVSLDTRSPVERFRRPPNKAFSVTDLISPAWCEVQYWYTLTKHGRKRRTAAMKKGSTIHKTLEDEIYTTVPVEVTTKEDALALRIWNVIQGLRTLREFGITRELEIWGLVDGELVNGVIDQLCYECPDTELEASAASYYAEAAASRAVLPEYQMSLTDYLLSPAQGGKRLADMSRHEVEPQAAEDPVSSQSTAELQQLPRIYLTDIKTRGSNSTPTVKSSSFRPTLLQLQLYYHMLNRLVLTDDVTIELLASRYDLDHEKTFTDAFICEVGSLNDQFFDAVSSLEFDPDYIPTPEDAITRQQISQDTGNPASRSDDAKLQNPSASQESISVLLAHNNLSRLWKLMKDQLRLTFLPPTLASVSVAPSIPSEFQPSMLEPYPTILSPLLTARYISSAPTADLHPRVLGSRSFLFDPTSLEAYVSDQMTWWRGQRTPRGVEVMETWKCRICEFQDECEWRQEREWAYARKKQRNAAA